MIKNIIIVLTIVIVLTLVMFYLLKKIVDTINEQSKIFFMMKLQSYDDLIEEKEKKLVNLKENTIKENNETKEKTSEKVNVVIQDSIPKYEVEGLLEVIKKIDSEFNFDIENIIMQFAKISHNFNNDYYKKLLDIKNKINNYGLFNIVIKDEKKQLDVLKELNINDNNLLKTYYFNYKKFDINNFLKVLEIEIKKNDPIIYVYVGDQNKKFENIDINIKTCFDKAILKGIKIKYHNVMYEYSLSY